MSQSGLPFKRGLDGGGWWDFLFGCQLLKEGVVLKTGNIKHVEWDWCVNSRGSVHGVCKERLAGCTYNK